MQNVIKSKNILIGVTAGIAAYKVCELVRLYKKQGANVKVLMTENAQKFVIASSSIIPNMMSSIFLYLNGLIFLLLHH